MPHQRDLQPRPAWFTRLRRERKQQAPPYHRHGGWHFTPEAQPAPTPRRILVVKLFALGDMLNITPALRALRQTFPDARITVLANRGGAAGLQRSPFVDEVLIFDKSLFDQVGGLLSPRALLAGLRFALTLRRQRFDTLILLHHLITTWGTVKYAVLALWSGAPVRVGLDNGRGWFLTHRVRDDGFGAVDERQYWLRIVAALGAVSDDDRPQFTVTAADRANGQRLLAKHPLGGNGPIVVMHPTNGTYAPGRQWPASHFAAVADTLATDLGARIVLVGVEVAAINALAAMLHQPHLNLAGKTDLPTLAGLFTNADLLIGNDSSLAHLSAALGVPTIALFGPSNDRAWRPWSAQRIVLPINSDQLPPLSTATNVLAVRSAVSTAPCLYTGFGPGNPHGCPNCRCLEQIDPHRITLLARFLLQHASSSLSVRPA